MSKQGDLCETGGFGKPGVLLMDVMTRLRLCHLLGLQQQKMSRTSVQEDFMARPKVSSLYNSGGPGTENFHL